MTAEILSYWVAIAVGLVSLAALSWSAIRYVSVKQAEIRQQRFENIQRLIKLYSNWSETGHAAPMPLAPQMSAAFEFRNYPEYKDLFLLLLKHHKFEGPNAGLINGLVEESVKKIDKHWWGAA